MKFKTFLRGIQLGSLLALAAMLGGCASTWTPGSSQFAALSNHTLYGLVQYIGDAQASGRGQEYCKLLAYRDPQCSHLSDFDHASTAIARDAWGTSHAGLLIPKSANVRVGDIIKFKFASETRPQNQFEGIAARAADTQRLHCGWVGSKIAFSGGVVCDGWRYDKDFPLLAH